MYHILLEMVCSWQMNYNIYIFIYTSSLFW